MTHELLSFPVESIEDSILLIRSQKVILDRAVAKVYGVSIAVLKQTVKENLGRFPPDFMFQLTVKEAKTVLRPARSRLQTVTLKQRPYVFTEDGFLMLSSVLKSKRAVQVNIQMIRSLVRVREKLADNEKHDQRFAELEDKYDCQFEVVFEEIHRLTGETVEKRNQIGFTAGKEQEESGVD